MFACLRPLADRGESDCRRNQRGFVSLGGATCTPSQGEPRLPLAARLTGVVASTKTERGPRVSLRRSTRVSSRLAAFAALVALGGCADAGMDLATSRLDPCELEGAPVVEGHTGRFWFVRDASCGGGGDGTRERPFTQVQQAVSAAMPGDTVVVGPGTWEGGVTLPAGVHLAALTKGTVTLRGGPGLRVDGDGDTTVQGLVVSEARGAGVMIGEGAARLVDVTVEKATKDGALPGHGVVAEGTASLILTRTTLTANAGLGLLAKGTGRVAIIEPIYEPSPRGKDGKFGIIEPIYLPTSRIVGNGLGGVAIIEPIYSPTAPNLRLESTLVSGNQGFGVGLWGASASVVNSAVVSTRVGPGGPWADGVLFAKGVDGQDVTVTIDARSVVLDNARTGVAMLARGTLAAAADISGNSLCGVWAGSSGSVSLSSEAVFGRNVLAGVAVSDGASLEMTGATVRGTVAADIGARGDDAQAGDGIGVFDGARATITNVNLVGNARAGVLVHQAATKDDGTPDVTITGSTVTGGKYAVVVNGTPAPSFAANNKYQRDAEEGTDSGQSSGGGGTAQPGSSAPDDLDNADVPVKTSICDAGQGCTPSF